MYLKVLKIYDSFKYVSGIQNEYPKDGELYINEELLEVSDDTKIEVSDFYNPITKEILKGKIDSNNAYSKALQLYFTKIKNLLSRYNEEKLQGIADDDNFKTKYQAIGDELNETVLKELSNEI